jgi:hypothetical protein
MERELRWTCSAQKRILSSNEIAVLSLDSFTLSDSAIATISQAGKLLPESTKSASEATIH